MCRRGSDIDLSLTLPHIGASASTQTIMTRVAAELQQLRPCIGSVCTAAAAARVPVLSFTSNAFAFDLAFADADGAAAAARAVCYCNNSWCSVLL